MRVKKGAERLPSFLFAVIDTGLRKGSCFRGDSRPNGIRQRPIIHPVSQFGLLSRSRTLVT
jgi:hypothetical protein